MTKYFLLFFTNSGKIHTLAEGSYAEMSAKLTENAKVFNDAARYKVVSKTTLRKMMREQNKKGGR